MSGERERRAIIPWAGMFLGAAAWAVQHQFASDLIDWDCQLGGPLLTGGAGLVALLVTIAGGVISWRARKQPGPEQATIISQKFAGACGAGCAGMFALAILFGSLSGFIIPACHR